MRSIVTASSLAMLIAMAAGASSPPSDHGEREALAAAVAAIRRADYHGDRAALLREIRALPAAPSGALGKYWLYWQGFAHWRRALIGEATTTPTPTDLLADAKSAAAAFRAALAADPSFEDARTGLRACLGNQLFLLAAESPERAAVLDALRPENAQSRDRNENNPRSLWIAGGTQVFAPPPIGGDLAKAEAIYLSGLEAARREALADTPREPWVPAWGAPELLMSLAYMYSRAPLTDRNVARAYALGALALVPDWSYVKDVLLPQIESLPVAKPAAKQ